MMRITDSFTNLLEIRTSIVLNLCLNSVLLKLLTSGSLLFVVQSDVTDAMSFELNLNEENRAPASDDEELPLGEQVARRIGRLQSQEHAVNTGQQASSRGHRDVLGVERSERVRRLLPELERDPVVHQQNVQNWVDRTKEMNPRAVGAVGSSFAPVYSGDDQLGAVGGAQASQDIAQKHLKYNTFHDTTPGRGDMYSLADRKSVV